MAETLRITVPQEVVTIEVNDNGDTIVLPISDERLNKRLIDFATKISEESEKIESFESDDIVETVDKDIQFHEMLKTEFDNLFGEDAYKKVYGDDVLVGAEYVIEFIDKCLPIIQQYSMKRAEKVSKYSANRVGSTL